MVFIRPVYVGERLSSIALARTKHETLVDSDIIEHFPPDTPGRDISAMALEFGYAQRPTDIQWAGPINND